MVRVANKGRPHPDPAPGRDRLHWRRRRGRLGRHSVRESHAADADDAPFPDRQRRAAPRHRAKCREALVRLHEAGKIPMFYGPGVMFHFAPNEVYLHAIRVAGDATDPDDLTRAEMQGRADAWAMWEAWKREVPGFEKSYFIGSYPFIGVRETRRILGPHVLSEDDIRAAAASTTRSPPAAGISIFTPTRPRPARPRRVWLPARAVRHSLPLDPCQQAQQSARRRPLPLRHPPGRQFDPRHRHRDGPGPGRRSRRRPLPRKGSIAARAAGTLVRQTLEQQHAGPLARM